MAAKNQQRNEVLNCAVGSVRSHFGAEGFDMVLLKGQGNLCNYSKDLCRLRNSGDIDVWAMPKGIEMWTLKERLKIMQAGNFGHYDVREKKTKKENGVQRLIRRQRRNMRFFSQYTEEVISVPIYRIYQEYWRIKMKMKCK